MLPVFGGMPKGISVGFIDIDHYFKPGPGDLIIVAARPSMGKTAFVLDVARNFAVKNDQAVMIFSLEMTAEQLVGRMISAQSGVESKKKRLTSTETMRVTKSSGDISASPLYIDETPAISIGEIKARARSLARKVPISLIIVDYIQLVTPTRQSDNRSTEVGEISAGLKAIAREINCPVIALSQLNRAVEQRNDRRPLMSDLRESGSIEQDADVVSFLYREEYYAKDRTPSELVGVAEFIIGKNRNGPTGSVRLSFNSSLPRFGNLEIV
jgi:replicative DNA helicase